MLPGCSILPCTRSADVFDRIEAGDIPIAVIPSENSLAGSVTEHFALLLARNVFNQREFRLRIVHHLISAPGVKQSDIRRPLWPTHGPDTRRAFCRNDARHRATPLS